MQRRRVVDAIAGHRHDITRRLQHAHDLQLVARRHAGEHRGVADSVGKRRLAFSRQRIKLDTGQRLRGRCDDAEIDGDAQCGAGMVAGDHHYADAGSMCLADRCCRRWPRRVDHADGADIDQSMLKLRTLRCAFAGIERAKCHGQGSQGGVGQSGDINEDARAHRAVERHTGRADLQLRAARQQHIRRALDDQQRAVVIVVVGFDRRHHAARRGEWNLADAAKALLAAIAATELALGHRECGFGRVALNRPAAVRVLQQRGIASQAAAAEHGCVLVMQRTGRQFDPAVLHLTDWRVADAGHGAAAGRGDHADDGHFTARERAGLVGGNDRSRAERLDRGQLLDHGMVPGHALHAQRQHHRQDRRKTFRHRRHRQRYPEQHHADDIGCGSHMANDQDRHDHRDGDHHRRQPQDLADVGHLHLQRRRRVFGRIEHRRHGTDFGLHADRRDHGTPGALGNRGALEHHVPAVAQRRGSLQCGGVLQHRLALTGQRGFEQTQVGSVGQARIGPDGIAFVEDQQITAHQCGAGNALQLPGTQHAGRGLGHSRQRCDGTSSLGLLHPADHGIEHDDDGDNDRVQRPAVAPFDDPGRQRHGGSQQQQVDQRILQLRQGPTPGGHGRHGTEFIGTVARQPASGLGGRQTAGEVGLAGDCDRVCGDDRRILRHGARRRDRIRRGTALNHGVAWLSSNSMPGLRQQVRCSGSRRTRVRAIAQRRIASGLATAEGHRGTDLGTELHRPDVPCGAVRAIAERLGLASAAGAPPVILALHDLHGKRGIGRADGCAHVGPFGSVGKGWRNADPAYERATFKTVRQRTCGR